MSTWRHTFYGQCLILLIAGCTYGQWDTNAWPAYEHPRAGKIHAMNCYSSLWERASTYRNDPGTAAGSAPSLFRTQKSYCSSLKTKTVSFIDSGKWICPTSTPESIATTINNYSQNPYGSVAYDVEEYSNIFSRIDFLQYNKLPTNFFDYTPYRGLDGIGPFTNDATVGRSHGWTNSYTLAGGTNFPSGRTNWYTTDYGWDGLRAIVNSMSIRQIRVQGAAWNSGGGLWGNGESTNSFSEAKTFAEGSLTNSYIAGYDWLASKQLYSPTHYYKTRMLKMSYSEQLPTNGPAVDATGIFRTWPILISATYPNDTFGYDGTQLGYTRRGAWTNDLGYGTIWGWQIEPATNLGNFAMTFYIGGTDHIPDEPVDATNQQYTAKGVGLRYYDPWVDYQSAMMQLNYTNDFKYK